MNTAQFIKEVGSLTGDKHPTISWSVNEEGSLECNIVVMVRGKKVHDLLQRTGDSDDWGTESTDDIFYQTTIGVIKRYLNENRGAEENAT